MTKHTVTRIFVRSVLGIADLQQPEAVGCKYSCGSQSRDA